MSKLTKEEFDSIYSDDITKKEYDRIINKINIRFEEICNDILKPYAWYDFDNLDEYSQGYFDPERYKQTIYVTGEGLLRKGQRSFLESVYGNERCPNTEFPTHWLYEDYSHELKQKIDLFEISLNAYLSYKKS